MCAYKAAAKVLLSAQKAKPFSVFLHNSSSLFASFVTFSYFCNNKFPSPSICLADSAETLNSQLSTLNFQL